MPTSREGDATTERLRKCAEHWREIAALSDEQVAELVRDDQIDILVDLSGHIAGNRLLVFAHKPAPVQVTYIGYQNTTGMPAMDYRLTDAVVRPARHDRLPATPRSWCGCREPSSAISRRPTHRRSTPLPAMTVAMSPSGRSTTLPRSRRRSWPLGQRY